MVGDYVTTGKPKPKLSIILKQRGIRPPSRKGIKWSDTMTPEQIKQKFGSPGLKHYNWIDGRGSYSKLKKKYCERCKTTEKRLSVHHKDKSHSNNDISNLETLCYKCHNNHHRNTIYDRSFV